jgi:putative oxidoreductase
MWKKLFQTNDDVAALVLRLMLGIVFFPHGMQKLLGWFGGHGFEGTMGFFTGKLGIPALFAFLAIIAESLGAIGLIVGLGTRIAAFGISITIAVAAMMLHVQNGFFMNWFGSQTGEGIEYHLLVIGMGVALMIAGGGKWSLDRALAGSREN